ncbi:MAG: hypothetical protein FJ279_00885 [Planctomycetes bacterium]|nr:hypothetical protein [Planctomycetota bacterium]MBM4085891.1 hypothetical protein [Planctomycetota bacterium]
MKRSREPKVLAELHKIREEMAREAGKVGVMKYYLAMNERSGWDLGDERKKARAVQVAERPARYGRSARKRS